MVKLLLGKGALRNLTNNEDYTPLYYAEANNHAMVIELLIQLIIVKH